MALFGRAAKTPLNLVLGPQVLCPHDKTLLAKGPMDGHSGHVCPECHGTWLPFRLVETIQLRRTFSPDDFIR